MKELTMTNKQMFLAYIGTEARVLWHRKVDNKWIESPFVLSDYNFNILEKQGKLLLFPLPGVDAIEALLEAYGLDKDWIEIYREGAQLLDAAPYSVIRLLISKHIDVFGMIEKGLATDMRN